MSSFEQKLRRFAVELHRIDAVKFGEYKTKVGLMTPVYCDLRVIVSYPKLMMTLADLIVEHVKDLKTYDVVCGVPYTALPIATAVSCKVDIPMVMRRKEAKDYGTKKLIEGVFKEGDRCLIVEDVVTSGSSILETVKDLNGAGLKCTDAVILLNRQQGGQELLAENGIKMHALLTLTQLMEYLREEGLVDDEMCAKVASYIESSRVDASMLKKSNNVNRLKMPFEERMQHCKNDVGKRLFRIMQEKKTNLCLAADLTDPTDLLNLAESVGPHICLFKTHVDVIDDFNDNFTKCLEGIAAKHNFLLFEDRKYADIGKTVQLQYSKGVFSTSSWAPLVTAHSVTGPSVLDALKSVEGPNGLGVFLLAETSAKGSLIDEKYTMATLKMGLDRKDLVVGFVSQSPLFLDEPGMIALTPGVQMGGGADLLGQQYNSPEYVVMERGADVVVVGRGITNSSKPPEVAAEEYRKVLWSCYLDRIRQG